MLHLGLFRKFIVEPTDLSFSIKGTILSKKDLIGKEDMVSIIIPEGITVIEEGAFENCRVLSKVSLPSTLRKIEWWAFGWCHNLKSVEISDEISYIECWSKDKKYQITSFKPFSDLANKLQDGKEILSFREGEYRDYWE